MISSLTWFELSIKAESDFARKDQVWQRRMKYILVSGGVISGVGKGVVASSLGVILKQSNVAVTSIKIDPYINIDAGKVALYYSTYTSDHVWFCTGTFSPYEHGEVYVLDDGGEVDLDLGNYERYF